MMLMRSWNDALLVALGREGTLGNLATFDTGFDQVEGLRSSRSHALPRFQRSAPKGLRAIRTRSITPCAWARRSAGERRNIQRTRERSTPWASYVCGVSGATDRVSSGPASTDGGPDGASLPTRSGASRRRIIVGSYRVSDRPGRGSLGLCSAFGRLPVICRGRALAAPRAQKRRPHHSSRIASVPRVTRRAPTPRAPAAPPRVSSGRAKTTSPSGAAATPGPSARGRRASRTTSA